MKYPIGIQTFENIREDGFVYVDKTDLIYKLTQSFNYVFLGRPRRFGKSLLLSTIEAYFEGRKELFNGLAIEKLESDWIQHPVLHFDLNTGEYGNKGAEEVERVLSYQISRYERIYGGIEDSISNRLINLVESAAKQTGQKVVVLIDEYDKPILSTMHAPKKQEAMRIALKSLYGCLKTCDKYIRFAMLTGVSKFGKMSVFSDLNNIEDISLNKNFATICGITEEEMIATFEQEISSFARNSGVATGQMIEDLRNMYDGYRFSQTNKLVYNPFSLLCALKNSKLNDYWFESGTPTFLVELLRKNDYDLSRIEGEKIDEDSLYRIDNLSVIPLLYQTGYLTIKDYDNRRGLCVLDYPNQEVKRGFLNFLVPYYSNVSDTKSIAEIFDLVDEVESGDIDAFMTRLQSIFYSIPYAKDKSMKVQEDQFRNLLYIIFKLLGMQIQVECPMSKGRSDAVVVTQDHIYVMEFKVNKTPEEALAQIHEKGYALPYASDPRPVTLIGINYSTAERAITGWLAQQQE